MITKKAMLAVLALIPLLGTYDGSIHASSTAKTTQAAQVVPTVDVPAAAYAFDTKNMNTDYFVKNGTTYLSLQQCTQIFSDLVWSYDKLTGYLYVSGPNRTLSWKLNTRTPLMNGISRKASAPLIQKNGGLSIPLRDFMNWSGGKIQLYKDHTMIVSYPALSIISGNPQAWYWVRRDNGMVYTAVGSEMPHNIGQSVVRANQYVSMTVLNPDLRSVVLEVKHNYGEPSLGNDIYRLYIHNGKLVREAKVSYYGAGPVESITEAEGMIAMLQGSKLLLVRPDGTLAKSYDLKKQGGFDENYTVEYASAADDTLIIRPFQTGSLLLVSPNFEAPVVLYKELLSKEEQDLFEQFEKNPMTPPSDNLKFMRREGNTFFFKHTDRLGKEETLTYTPKN